MSNLQDLRDLIFLNGPEHFDMGVYVCDRTLGDEEEAYAYPDKLHKFSFDNCGTVGCIAGQGAWLMYQNGMRFIQEDTCWADTGRRVGEHYGIPHYRNLFSNRWEDVPFGDGTLEQHRLALQAELVKAQNPYSWRESEWSAALDYLDHCIKEEMNTKVSEVV